MAVFIIGLVILLGTHSISIVAPSWRGRVTASIGEGPWKGLYALASLLGFALLVWGYGMARQETAMLYTPPAGLRHVTLFLMLFVFPLLFAAYLPGRIKTAIKHPMLAAIKIWAFAHLLANGSVVDVILFGSFLVWAVAERVSIKHRTPRPVPGPPPTRWNDAIAVVAGLAVYAAFVLGVHRWLIGVSPLG